MKNPDFLVPGKKSKSHHGIKKIISATFPDFGGRKVTVVEKASVILHNLNWSGGTRSQYRSCTVDGSPLGGADKFNQQAPWANQAEGVELPIPAGACLVEHWRSCGTSQGLTIYVRPASAGDSSAAFFSLPEVKEAQRLQATASRFGDSQHRNAHLEILRLARLHGVEDKFETIEQYDNSTWPV